jgi:hypothetical protein
MLRRIWRTATPRLTALKGGAAVCKVLERPAHQPQGRRKQMRRTAGTPSALRGITHQIPRSSHAHNLRSAL